MPTPQLLPPFPCKGPDLKRVNPSSSLTTKLQPELTHDPPTNLSPSFRRRTAPTVSVGVNPRVKG